MRRQTGAAAAALLWLALAAAPAHADPQSELDQARRDLAISEQVLARMTERAAIVRSDPAVGPEQRQRLDQQVARVQALVTQNRERVRTLSQTVASLPAGSAAGTARDGKAAPAATQAEEVAALEARLGVSLEEFDQLLLEEARRARTRGPSSASGLPGGSGGGAAGEGRSGSGGAVAKTSGPASDGKTGSERSSGEAGTPRVEGSEPATPGATAARPPDVGDGSDDDVVARQIRRAAESEPDPALREKLWDEYRKYKRGAKG